MASVTNPANRPYKPYGAAFDMWKSRDPEVLMAGPADTGKSRAILEKLHYCAQKYDGARILIVRKSRESLTHSVMVTYENKVLPLGYLESVIKFRTVEQQYVYPNHTIIAVGGMDKPAKLLSSEWDLIYAAEATELDEHDWEILSSRLRNGVMPYQQLVGDCNPSHPRHWLKQRCDRGATRLLTSRHQDNPSITKERLERLQSLTGVRYQRYYLGLWAAAEGLVYDEWDDRVHLVNKRFLVNRSVLRWDDEQRKHVWNTNAIHRVLAGVDFGWTNPGCIHIYGLDNDDRLYLLRELYMSHKTDDWWVEQALHLDDEFGVEQWICDPSSPASIEKFKARGLPAIKADNAISSGIDAVKARLELAGDGKPRLYVYNDALKEKDPLREQNHEPTGLLSEILEYTWAPNREGFPLKEVPTKMNDHACFIAGTKVRTIAGDKPIERIMRGDLVMTRSGARRVLFSAQVGVMDVYTLYFEDGTTLTGTQEHPIWTQEEGFVPLIELNYRHTLLRCDEGSTKVSAIHHRMYEVLPVYNITVYADHEYFANGILVKNCDVLRYVCKYLDVPRIPMYETPEEKNFMQRQEELRQEAIARAEDTSLNMNNIDPFEWLEKHGGWGGQEW